eukprot:GHVQ01014727.1.p2 GENE.GHVQ01014727.1~~GHVQ01014727.1.p2  ORF type:complete len:175 (+),score=16.32 GHVQ01014727.1:681-1205(+)
MNLDADCEQAAAVLLRRYQPLFTDGESFSRYSLATVILQCLMGNYGLAVAGAKVLRGTTTPNLLYKGAAHVVMGMGYLRDAFFDKSLEEFQASSDLPDLGFWSLTDLLTKELLSLYLGLCAMAVLPFKTVCSMVRSAACDFVVVCAHIRRVVDRSKIPQLIRAFYERAHFPGNP